MEDDPLITIADVRHLFCVKGTKKVFEAAGVDFTNFIKNGCRASELKGHGYDAAIDRVVDSIKSKERQDG